MNIGTIIDAAAVGDPDRVALIIDRDANQLRRAGRRRRTLRRAVWLPTVWRPEAASPSSTAGACCRSRSMLGAARIGAAAALMNPALTHAQSCGP